MIPKLFADFHNTDRSGRVRLNCVGTTEALDTLGITLHAGMKVFLYSEDVAAEAFVHYSIEEQIFVAALTQQDDSGSLVNHPDHYGGDTTYEAIKVIEAWNLGFCLGNAIKYLCRSGKKGSRLQDLEKAHWYLTREIEHIKQQEGSHT
jgi:hypothetical protein